MSKKILLVEDDQVTAYLLSSALRAENYQVEVLAEGNNAFRRATEEQYDLYIFDIVVPRKSGVDLCQNLRRMGDRTPVLLLSGLGDLTDHLIRFEFGADAYLAKPVDTQELLQTVRSLLSDEEEMQTAAFC